ncbi:uncharacterized protein LOC120145796 [Hibiscus syriacus]|uniref:uncharacterized protein LOC120145796 n=1 Tax=Hibiscus syriacus TaxID=106335 RepID=UPI001923FB5C|nr:uncharacterized protein LOC120145796 [Hibiscus syriacus]
MGTEHKILHTCASVRRKRNALNALIVDGNTTHDPIVIKAKVKDHFFKIYNDRSTLEVEDIGLVFPRISFEQNMLLEKEFSEEETQIMNVKRVLRVFEVYVRLQLNLKKSRLFGINISQQEVKTWADSIGCLVGNFPSNYLGLPLGATRNSSVIWEPVVQNFHSKLAGWKAATLSLAGRLIPASILKTLNSIMSNFLWGGGNGIKKILG